MNATRTNAAAERVRQTVLYTEARGRWRAQCEALGFTVYGDFLYGPSDVVLPLPPVCPTPRGRSALPLSR